MRDPAEPHQPGHIPGAWTGSRAGQEGSWGIPKCLCGNGDDRLWVGSAVVWQDSQTPTAPRTALGWAETEPWAMEQGCGSPREPGRGCWGPLLPSVPWHLMTCMWNIKGQFVFVRKNGYMHLDLLGWWPFCSHCFHKDKRIWQGKIKKH